ncbi:MAG: MFS transporter [Firmicutes bacterium]|jgi:MFS family permease|nr:MFS transporter [Bacillota bacterium]
MSSSYDDNRSRKWLIFALCSCAYFLSHFHRVSPAVIAENLLTEYAITAAQLGLLASTYFYVYCALQIPFGIFTDMLGSRAVISISTAIATVGVLLFSASHTWRMAVAARVITGLGAAGVYIPTLQLLSRISGPGEFSTMVGLFGAAGHLGSLVATSPLALAVSAIGWRQSFVIIGVITILVTVACWVFLRNPEPAQTGATGVLVNGDPPAASADRRSQAHTCATSNAGGNAARSRWTVLSGLLPIMLLGATAFFKYGPLMGYQGLWGVPYLMDVKAMTKIEASNMMMVVSLACMVGGPLAGFLVDRLGFRRRVVFVTGSLLYALAWVPLAFFTASAPTWLLYASAVLIGVPTTALAVVGFGMAKDYAGSNKAGTGMAVVNACTLFGAAVFQPLMGCLIDKAAAGGPATAAAYASAFRVTFAGVALMVVGAYLIRDPKDRAVGSRGRNVRAGVL